MGPRAGGVALEPRSVCRDEVSMFLLLGVGVGIAAWACGVAGRNDRGFAFVGSRGRACVDLDDGGVLFAAGIASVGGRMVVFIG